jgi:hypothetical protein
MPSIRADQHRVHAAIMPGGQNYVNSYIHPNIGPKKTGRKNKNEN